jgi:hypothetical protein
MFFPSGSWYFKGQPDNVSSCVFGEISSLIGLDELDWIIRIVIWIIR